MKTATKGIVEVVNFKFKRSSVSNKRTEDLKEVLKIWNLFFNVLDKVNFSQYFYVFLFIFKSFFLEPPPSEDLLKPTNKKKRDELSLLWRNFSHPWRSRRLIEELRLKKKKLAFFLNSMGFFENTNFRKCLCLWLTRLRPLVVVITTVEISTFHGNFRAKMRCCGRFIEMPKLMEICWNLRNIWKLTWKFFTFNLNLEEQRGISKHAFGLGTRVHVYYLFQQTTVMYWVFKF